MKNNIKGAGVALVTPFTIRGEVDYESLGKLIDHVIAGGVDYLVVLGTTAETPTLTSDEKASIISFIRERNAGRCPMIVGIGGNNTCDIARQVEKFDFTGFEAVLSVTPYYNKPTQRGLFEHYKTIAEASPVPVLLYNVPGRTGVNMSADTTLKIAHEVDNILGIKEACGNLSQVAYILRDRPKKFQVISGDDNMALSMIALGADGVISVAANAFPKRLSHMIHLALEGKIIEAAGFHLNMLECVDALFAEGNPAGIKAALAEKDIILNKLRLPLVEVSDELSMKIARLMEEYGLE